MEFSKRFSILVILVLVTACTPSSAATSIPASIVTTTSTKTPTALASVPSSAILLGSLVRGSVNGVLYSRDSNFILAAFDAGIVVLRAGDMSEAGFLALPEPAQCLALFSNDQEIAIGTRSGTILFARFDPSSGVPSASVRAPLHVGDALSTVKKDEAYDPKILGIAGSQDGKFVGISTAVSAQAWNLESGQPVLDKAVTGRYGPAYANNTPLYQLAFSSDSQSLLFGGPANPNQETSYLVDLPSGTVRWNQKIGAFLLGKDKLVTFTTQPKGYQIASLSTPDNPSEIIFPQLASPNVYISDLIFSADGTWGAAIYPQTVRLFHTTDGIFVNINETLPAAIYLVGIPSYLSNRGVLVATASYEEKSMKPTGPFAVDLLSADQVHIPISLPVETPFRNAYLMAPDGENILYFKGPSLQKIELKTNKVLVTQDSLASGVTALAFSPDGKTLAVGQQDFSVTFFNADQGLNAVRTETLPANQQFSCCWFDGVSGLAFSSDGDWLLAGTSQGGMHALALQGGFQNESAYPWKAPANVEIYGLAISPVSNTLTTGGNDAAVRLWKNFPGGEPDYQLLDDKSPVTALAYTADGEQLAAGMENGLIRIWQPDGRLLHTLQGHTGRVTGLAFVPGSGQLISVAEDGSARFWNVDSGVEMDKLNLNEPGTSLALDVRGEMLALGTQSGNVYIWDLPGKRWLGNLHSVGLARALAFSPDGARLATSAETGQVQLWQVRGADGKVLAFPAGEPAEPAPEACQLDAKSIRFDQAETTFVAGTPARLTWHMNFQGGCTGLDEHAIRKVVDLPEIASRFTFSNRTSGGSQQLIVSADVSIPNTEGTYNYGWELAAPGGGNSLAATLTVSAQAPGASLPAPLYFVSESGMLMRLEKDGHTQTPVIAAPVSCMDISAASGEIAYLTGDALMLVDANGSNPRSLLSIGGCPAWSPDGKLIAFVLNGLKVLEVASGEVQVLDRDVPLLGKYGFHYQGVSGWSPSSAQLIASRSGWDSVGYKVFDLSSGENFGLQAGWGSPVWSRDGQSVYSGEAYYNCYFGQPPFLVRTNVNTRQVETLLGGSDADLTGGSAPFETTDGRLLVFASHMPGDPCSGDQPPQPAVVAAQVSLTTPGLLRYDPNPHPILSPSSVLWWRDGSLAIVQLERGEVLATRPFSTTPNLYLPLRGGNFIWDPTAPGEIPASTPSVTATPPPAPISTTNPALARYSLGFIGGAAANSPQIVSLRADGTNLMRSYPTFAPSTPMAQIAWAADGQSLFALGESGWFYQARKLDSQFYEYVLPEGLPLYTVPVGGGLVKDFSLSPNGRYLALVYVPKDEALFNPPKAGQRLERDNLGILDLQTKNWIDVNIPVASSNFPGKAAILLSASGWSKDSQQLVVTATQVPGLMAQVFPAGLGLFSFSAGGGGDETTGLVVANIYGGARNITLNADPEADTSSEILPVWAANGQIYYYSTDDTGKPGLYRINPSGGGQTRLVDCEDMDVDHMRFVVAPDGRKIAARIPQPETGDLGWAIIDTGNRQANFLPTGMDPVNIPIWSPDGSRLVWFGHDEAQAPKIFVIDAAGSKLVGLSLPAGLSEALHLAWSPDGAWLAFRSALQSSDLGLYVMRADGTGAQLVSSDLMEAALSLWSPVILKRP